MFPFDARVFKRDDGGWSDERSGIDFLARSAEVELDKVGFDDAVAEGPVEADRYEDWARDRVCEGCLGGGGGWSDNMTLSYCTITPANQCH